MNPGLQKAMLLAAGKGERMRHLTENTPKPLLQVAGKSMLAHQLDKLAAAGFNQVVINLGHFGEQIKEEAIRAASSALTVSFSDEGEEPLETAGGILKAMPLLAGGPFLVINSDVWCDYPLDTLPADPEGLVHLIMVDNPEHHPEGDFALKDGRVHLQEGPRYTYSGIGVYRPELFDECQPGKLPLAPLIRHAASMDLVSGEHHTGVWQDVGTPERLAELNASLAD
jgi:MurNAc alpha-1-phosphate uridylyltransferase